MKTFLKKALIWVFVGILVFLCIWVLIFANELSTATNHAKRSTQSAIDIQSRLDTFIDAHPELTLLFVGDVMLSRGVGSKIEVAGDYKYPFLLSADVLRSADFTFGNLETPISNRGINQGSIYSFRSDPRVIEGLVYAGFDVLSLANNHIWDWGPQALLDTRTLLDDVGIASVGAGVDFKQANEPAFIKLQGAKIAVLAYTNLFPRSMQATADNPGLSNFDLDEIKQKIVAFKDEGYLVMVSFHGGNEYELSASSSQREIARALIDAGADLFIGHHPHVVQEAELYKNGWIAYSLGNFIFDQNFSKETMAGAVLEVKVQYGKVVGAKLLPVQISPDFQAIIGINSSRKT